MDEGTAHIQHLPAIFTFGSESINPLVMGHNWRLVTKSVPKALKLNKHADECNALQTVVSLLFELGPATIFVEHGPATMN